MTDGFHTIFTIIAIVIVAIVGIWFVSIAITTEHAMSESFASQLPHIDETPIIKQITVDEKYPATYMGPEYIITSDNERYFITTNASNYIRINGSYRANIVHSLAESSNNMFVIGVEKVGVKNDNSVSG